MRRISINAQASLQSTGQCASNSRKPAKLSTVTKGRVDTLESRYMSALIGASNAEWSKICLNHPCRTRPRSWAIAIGQMNTPSTT